MKLKHLLAVAVMAAIGGGNAWAQSVGDVLTVGGTKYEVKGTNLFTNGSFENGVDGWKATNYTTAAVASNFTITATGGVNDGAYITTNGAGATSEKTIRQSIAVENDKMYYFSVYTSGKAPSSNNYSYNALFKMTNATTENGVLKTFEWPQGADKTTSDWNKTEYVFTASSSYVGVRMGWNQNSNFDEFVLCEIDYYFDTQILTDEITAAQKQLDNYTEGKSYYESLNSAIQTAQAANPKDAASLNAVVQALKAAEADAAAEYKDDQVVQAHASEVYAYNAAMDDMQKIDGLSWSEATNQSGQHWNGTTSDKYYDTWSSSATTKTYTATISLPAGTYKLRAAGRGQAGTTTFIQVGDGEQTTFNNAGDTGYGIETDGTMNYSKHGTYANNNAGRGWEWRIIEFTLPSEQEVTLKCGYTLKNGTWASVCQPELFTATSNFAGDDEFNALKDAIEEAEAHTLGFAAGEYAPYTNIAALNLIKEAKTIDPANNYLAATVNAATDALSNATWNQNAAEVNAVYNGSFANSTPNATSGVDRDMPGWTMVDAIRMVVGDVNVDPALEATNDQKAFFMWGGNNAVYGEQEGYTMPLKEGVYELTFKATGWRDGDLPTWMNASLNGCTTVGNFVYPNKRINQAEGFVTNTVKIIVPSDGDYKLTIYTNKHAAFTDICLLRVPETEVNLTIGTAKVGTFVAPFDITLPEGVTAYTANVENEGWATMTQIATAGETLAAGTPVIVKSEETVDKNFNGQSILVKDICTSAGNALVGSLAAQTVPADGTYYALQNGSEGLGFYVIDNSSYKIKANRAYLKTEIKPENAARIRISFDGEETSIKNLESDGNDAPMYNVSGVRANNSYKGIVIKNGKKYVIK